MPLPFANGVSVVDCLHALSWDVNSTGLSSSVLWVTPIPYENGAILYSWQFPLCHLIRVYPRWKLVILGFLYPSIHVLLLWPNAMLFHLLGTSSYTKDPKHWWYSWIVRRKRQAPWPWAMPGFPLRTWWYLSPEPGEWAVLTLFSSLLHLTPESCHASPANPKIRLFCLFVPRVWNCK